jgi:hypothetical protein
VLPPVDDLHSLFCFYSYSIICVASLLPRAPQVPLAVDDLHILFCFYSYSIICVAYLQPGAQLVCASTWWRPSHSVLFIYLFHNLCRIPAAGGPAHVPLPDDDLHSVFCFYSYSIICVTSLLPGGPAHVPPPDDDLHTLFCYYSYSIICVASLQLGAQLVCLLCKWERRFCGLRRPCGGVLLGVDCRLDRSHGGPGPR